MQTESNVSGVCSYYIILMNFDNLSTRLIVGLVCIRAEKFARVCTLEIRNRAGGENVDKRREEFHIFLFGLYRTIFTLSF